MKLIRDRTPDLLRGSTRPVRDQDEHEILLRMKIMEEAAEVAASTSDEELIGEAGDLYEVMGALFQLRGITWDEVIAAAHDKFKRKGGFVDGTVLVHDPLDNKDV